MSNWRGTNPELVNNKIRRSKYNWILRHIYLVDEMGWYWWWLLLVPRSLTLKASYFQNGVGNVLKLHFFSRPICLSFNVSYNKKAEMFSYLKAVWKFNCEVQVVTFKSLLCLPFFWEFEQKFYMAVLIAV